jgi:endonuclease/exonuclease/phosphatase family metal-dependent hydrolase
MTWNIQNGGTTSLTNPNRRNIDNILGEIKKVEPDIIVIQEYESEYHNELVKDGLEVKEYQCTVCKDDEDKSLRNRVLIASKLKFDEIDRPSDILKYSRRNWNEIFVPDYRLRILGVDVPLAETYDMNGNKRSNEREKKAFLKALERKFIEYKSSVNPCVVLGDFNLHSNAVFSEFLSSFNSLLSDITTDEATWQSKKLDYIFVNDAFAKLLVDTKKISPNDTPYSDHKHFFVDVNAR